MTKKRVWLIVVALLLVVALWQMDRQSLWYSLRHVPLWLVGLLLGLQVVTQLLVNAQWYGIARIAGVPLSYGALFYVNSQGAVMDAITPGVKFGGEVTRAVQLCRAGHCTGEQAAALVALQKLFSLSALSLVLLFVAGMLSPWLYGALAVLLVLFGAVFVMPHRLQGYLSQRKAPRFVWIRRVRGFVLALLAQVLQLRRYKRAWVGLAGLSLLIWALYPVKMLLLVRAFYPDAGVLPVAAVTFAAYLVAMLPVFPGGLGGFEATMAGGLVAMGAAVSNAAVLTVVFRFAKFWFVMLGSLVYIALRGKNR